jgi:hypothetical protein
MNIYAWILVGAFVLSTLVSIGTIGKPRDPITPGMAVGVTILNAVFVALIYKAVTV